MIHDDPLEIGMIGIGMILVRNEFFFLRQMQMSLSHDVAVTRGGIR